MLTPTLAGLVALTYLVFAVFSAVIAWFTRTRANSTWLARFVWWHGALFVVLVLGGGTLALVAWVATWIGNLLV